jgi:hypothetical protein
MERESDGARVAACARRLWGRVTRVARRAETLRLVEECCGAPRLGSQASAAGEISSSTPRLRPNTWTTSSFSCSGASAGGVGQPGGALRLATLGIHVAGDGAGPHVAAQPRLRRGGAGAAQRTGVEPSRLRQQCHSGRPSDGGLIPAGRPSSGRLVCNLSKGRGDASPAASQRAGETIRAPWIASPACAPSRN